MLKRWRQRERERVRERQTQRDRDREIHRDRQRHRERHRETGRDRERTERDTERERERDRDTERESQREGENRPAFVFCSLDAGDTRVSKADSPRLAYRERGTQGMWQALLAMLILSANSLSLITPTGGACFRLSAFGKDH